MKPKASPHYQRADRQRLREQGLVKKEVWVLPANARILSALEKQLRGDVGQKLSKGVDFMTDKMSVWTTDSLYAALEGCDLMVNGQASIELMDGADATIHIVMKEYGDLPVFLTVSGEQVVVESVLWSADEVKDVVGFNEAILRTHKYFPLSTISLDNVGLDVDYYHMFGALSSTSRLPNIIFEIEVLADNVIQATEAYGEFLST
jgi:uncharacterized protein YjfI (DUF2170 family)